jgi:hypothetical protein
MIKTIFTLFIISITSSAWASNIDQLPLRERFNTLLSLFNEAAPISIAEVSKVRLNFKFILDNEESGSVQPLNNLINNVNLSISPKFLNHNAYSVTAGYIYEQDPYEKPYTVIRFKGTADVNESEARSNEVNVKNVGGFSSTLPPWYHVGETIIFKTAIVDNQKLLIVNFYPNIFGYMKL